MEEPQQPGADAGQGLPARRQPGSSEDIDRRVAALRAEGVHQLDPVRFAFIDALARRARGQRGALRRLLDQRLSQAVEAYRARHAATVADRVSKPPGVSGEHLPAAADLRGHRADGDPRVLRKPLVPLAIEPASGALADLVRQLDGRTTAGDHSSENLPAGARATAVAAASAAAPLRELRTAQRFRATWTRLRIDEQLRRSQQQAPENPGPLNSHLLVLRALHQLRERAPAYLEGLMAHGEVLAWLQEAQWPVVPNGPGTKAAPDRRARKGKKARS